MNHWAILTGEYPPQAGGVADYTRLVAEGLACAGDRVTVFAPACSSAESDGCEAVHRLPGGFGFRGRWKLGRCLYETPKPTRLLVQYVPHAFGWRGMNLPFAHWLARRAGRPAPLWVMFHEVAYPKEHGQSFRHAALAHATRRMAAVVANAAERVFVSTPAWAETLRELAPAASPAEWLPVPSTLPIEPEPAAVAAARGRFAPEAVVVGHFGTFGAMNDRLVTELFADVLRADCRRTALFVGRGSTAFRDAFAREHVDFGPRCIATGELSPSEAAAALGACDVLLQPYPDGATARRTSLMAGIALGALTVTNRGFLSEPIWGTESPGVAVAASCERADMAAAAERLLALSAEQRRQLGAAAAVWYRERFDLTRTIATLQSASAQRRAGAPR